jgi:hypothetical protein
MTSKIEKPPSGPALLDTSGEQQVPSSTPRRPPVTNVMLIGQQLAHAFGAAKALIARIPKDRDVAIEELRRWYDHQHPAERDHLLWQRFTGAEQTYGRLESAIRVTREALDVEHLALVQAEGERSALGADPLPATVEDEATGARVEALRRYQSLGIERQARQAAMADLERLLLAPEQTLGLLAEATVRLLEAVVTIEREAFVRRLLEAGELKNLRARFERLKAMANTHEAAIEKWSQRVGRPVRVPQIVFPWPPTVALDALLGAPAEGPELAWNEDPKDLST